MLAIVAIIFSAAVIFVCAEINTRRAMRSFIDRGCAGFRWRRRFPTASKSEIREFLDIFIKAFGFKNSWRLRFMPEDRVLDVYRALYPMHGVPDNLEMEDFALDLQKHYHIDIVSSWREDLPLADLFTKTRLPLDR